MRAPGHPDMNLDDAREDGGVILPVECNNCGEIFEWRVGIEEPSDRCPRCRNEMKH
jgi:predicted Zn-ribbon and HTH transcriptional regulator